MSEQSGDDSPSLEHIREVVRQQELVLAAQFQRSAGLDTRGLSLTAMFFGTAVASGGWLANLLATTNTVPQHLLVAALVVSSGQLLASALAAGSALYLSMQPPGYPWASLRSGTVIELNKMLHGIAWDLDQRIERNARTLHTAAFQQRLSLFLAIFSLLLGGIFAIDANIWFGLSTLILKSIR